MLVLRRAGLELAGPVTDTMVLSYLLESGERNHNLDQLARRLLDHAMIPDHRPDRQGEDADHAWTRSRWPRWPHYAGEDADATWRIEAILTPRVRQEGLWDLYADLERPLIAVLARMEAAGIKVDVPRLQQLANEFAAKLEAIEAEIYKVAGHPFNIGSRPQLRQVLFDELKLSVDSRRPPAASRAPTSEVLEELAGQHPLPRTDPRAPSATPSSRARISTPCRPWCTEDGRIHASFNQSVAATGRLSSSDPNLQNIPIRTESGGQIRQAFVAGAPDWSLLTADYSQIELRVLAHYSGDPALVRAFARGPRHPHAPSPPGSSTSPSRPSTPRSGGWPRRSTSA